MAVIQEAQFVCDFVFYSACGDHLARCISLLVKRTLGTRLDIVHIDAVNLLNMSDVVVISISLWVVVVYFPKSVFGRFVTLSLS